MYTKNSSAFFSPWYYPSDDLMLHTEPMRYHRRWQWQWERKTFFLSMYMRLSKQAFSVPHHNHHHRRRRSQKQQLGPVASRLYLLRGKEEKKKKHSTIVAFLLFSQMRQTAVPNRYYLVHVLEDRSVSPPARISSLCLERAPFPVIQNRTGTKRSRRNKETAKIKMTSSSLILSLDSLDNPRFGERRH